MWKAAKLSKRFLGKSFRPIAPSSARGYYATVVRPIRGALHGASRKVSQVVSGGRLFAPTQQRSRCEFERQACECLICNDDDLLVLENEDARRMHGRIHRNTDLISSTSNWLRVSKSMLKNTRIRLKGNGSADCWPRVRAAISVFVGLLFLAACTPPVEMQSTWSSSQLPPEYRQRLDGTQIIPAVNLGYLTKNNRRRLVKYNGPEKPGSIVIDPYARALYHIIEPGLAMRFGVAVGRAGEGFSGTAVIGRKEEYPNWVPTASMIRKNPELYEPVSTGIEGGLNNPLGVRALYLYRGGVDTYYRIHGTMDPSSIGHTTSAGCIRLFNQDIIDLFEAVPVGTRVVVRTQVESIKYEGVMLVQKNTGYVLSATDARLSLGQKESIAQAVEGAP